MLLDKIYFFVKRRYHKLKDKCYTEKLKKYLIANGVYVDFDTLHIPSTVQIYAGSNLHIGGGICNVSKSTYTPFAIKFFFNLSV